MKVWLYVLFFLLSGCGIGGFWMNGNPWGGENLTPKRDYWARENTMEEERKQDWQQCGGASNGKYITGMIDPDSPSARTQKVHGIQRCMLSNNYHYTGPCYDNEISQATPACMASMSKAEEERIKGM